MDLSPKKQNRRIIRHQGKFYDFGTSNLSWLQLASDLKTIGVKNWFFMLEVKDPEVLKINPYQVGKDGHCNLTKDQVSRVLTECAKNPWYYLREVCRIESAGNPAGVPYKANRGNIGQAWLLLHGIDSWLCLPRQQGKTQSLIALYNWIYSFGSSNSTIIFVNKQIPDAKLNLNRMKEQIDFLPEYMRFESYMEDEDGKVTKAVRNATEIRHPVTKNRVVVRSGSQTPTAASNTARGLTASNIHYDEAEFTENIDILVDNSVSTYDTAARAAEENGAIHGRAFTSTPADMDSNAGIASQKILERCKPWRDDLFDMSKEEMQDYAWSGNSNHIIYIEFMYYQIGLTEDWLIKTSEQMSDPLTARRELLLQRMHGSMNSPYAKEDIDYISEHAERPIKEVYLAKYYKFDLYEELDPSIPYIVGVDCSTGTLSDHNAMTAINPYTQLPVGEFECNYVGETEYGEVIIDLVTKHMPNAIICIERNSVGDAIIDALMRSRIASRLYFDRGADLLQRSMSEFESVESMLKKKASIKSYYGVCTTGVSREQMFGILANRIKEHKDKFRTQNVSRDIARLVKKNTKIEAGNGFHDDSIMSYLIAMYVYTYGNNLPAFGYIPGELLEDESQKNAGMHYTRERLTEVLPEDIANEIYERQEKKEPSFEEIYRNALAEAQAETAKLQRNKNLGFQRPENLEAPIVTYEEEEDMDLGIFDELNHLTSSPF